MKLVETLYESNSRDVVATLRLIASEIESGEYGDVHEAALVLHGNGLYVFGLGKNDGGTTHLLLTCGARKIENSVLEAV